MNKNSKELCNQLLAWLKEHSAEDIAILDVRKKSTITDWMVVASGRSERQINSLAERMIKHLKKDLQHPPFGAEGLESGGWALIDAGDVIVHLMHPETRDYYRLEELWS